MQRNGEKMKENNCILILTGGRIDTDFAAAYLRDKKFDRIIAADSGLASSRRPHLTPTDILGEFVRSRGAGLRAPHLFFLSFLSGWNPRGGPWLPPVNLPRDKFAATEALHYLCGIYE